MFNLFKKFTHKHPICNNFGGVVKNVRKGDDFVLTGKCVTCNNDFADHSCVKSTCPICGQNQPSQCGSVRGIFGKKYAIIKFNACDCVLKKRFSSVDPIYASLKPVACKCGKIVSHSENSGKTPVLCGEQSSPKKSFAFCGDLKCFMDNYYVPPQNVDLSVNGVKLPPLSFTSLSNTVFCACKNICEYDLENNVYKDKCRHCNLTD